MLSGIDEAVVTDASVGGQVRRHKLCTESGILQPNQTQSQGAAQRLRMRDNVFCLGQ